ncbi:MAG: helix-turn-helix transcriptional regulator [Deltaproteobacteria bacterium]|nr:helix-turn-helix transcriptional regulator [Deltaproteobacteria bacterium]
MSVKGDLVTLPFSAQPAVYITLHDGTCVVRYDNESGKGDHKHYGAQEELYGFTLVKAYGIPLAEVARQLGVSMSAISKAITRRTKE